MKKLVGLLVAFVLLLSAQVSFAGPQDFTLVNSSPSLICYLSVAPSSASGWGNNILPVCLFPGESVYVTMSGYGNEALFDIRIEDDKKNGDEFYRFNLPVISNVTILGKGLASFH